MVMRMIKYLPQEIKEEVKMIADAYRKEKYRMLGGFHQTDVDAILDAYCQYVHLVKTAQKEYKKEKKHVQPPVETTDG